LYGRQEVLLGSTGATGKHALISAIKTISAMKAIGAIKAIGIVVTPAVGG
jgi:hypothetical protein